MNFTDILLKKKHPAISKFPAIAAMLMIFIISGCGGDSATNTPDNGNGNGTEPPAEPAADEVWMVGTSFTPADRQVEAGTTVTWINQSNMSHTVTSGENGTHDGLFDSGSVDPDETYSYTFNEAGTYDYFCQPHVGQGMTGTITVTASSGSGNEDGY